MTFRAKDPSLETFQNLPARGWQAWPFLLAALAFSAVVYYPITGNYFLADDFVNLYQIENKPLLEYLFIPNAGHRLFARNAIFYLHSQIFGVHPEPYFWTVLVTHLVNVWLLFRVIRQLTASLYLASFGAVLWGTSPLHEGTLGWYSVYGHVLAGTVLLVILDSILRSRSTETELPRRREFLWFVLALVGANCFGIGVAIALVLPFAVWLLVPKWPRGPRRRRSLITLVAVVPLLYVIELRVYEAMVGRSIESLSFLARLVTNWKSNALALVQLVGFGATSLLFPFARALSTAPKVWYLLFGLLAVVSLAAFAAGRSDDRRGLAAIVLLLTACYGIIAVGRGVFLADLGYQLMDRFARYHYVGQALLAILVCLLLNQLPAVRHRLTPRLLGGAYAILLAAWLLSGPAIDHHLDTRQKTADVLASIRSFVDRTPAGQTVRIKNFVFHPLPIRRTIFPGWAAVFIIFFPENTVDGRRVLFVEKDPEVLERAKIDRRLASLLVPP